MTDGKERAPWLAELATRYAAKLPGFTEEILAALRAVPAEAGSVEVPPAEAGAEAASEREQAHHLAHRLAGTSGTYGFHEVSRLARQVELALSPTAGPTPDHRLLEAAGRALHEAAVTAAAEAEAESPEAEPDAEPAGD